MLAMVIIHIIYLHRTGSNNPLGITSNTDIIPFHPYYIYKDIIGFILLYLIYTILILYYPDIFGHSDNYIAADPLVTPPTIVPEFYFQAYYAILRAIPNKLLGVLTMLYGILILYQLPYNYNYNCNYAINKYNAYNAYKSNKYININIKCNSFRPIGKINY